MPRRPRYLPQEPFPPYTFVPGFSPHPFSHPDGHSYGVEPPRPEPLDPARWHKSRDYLRGVDLYNYGFPWEAHEAWEGLWQLAERGSPVHGHLQGLIQCAAAVVKALAGTSGGVASLSASGVARLEGVIEAVGSPFLGVDLLAFTARFRAYTQVPRDQAAGREARSSGILASIATRRFKPKNWPIIELEGIQE